VDAITTLTVLVLSVFVGFEVVSKVSSTLLAVLLSTANLVGGFVVTDRMLQMFGRRPKPAAAPAAKEGDK
jgi:NAD(P) transhydrogenase subunit alpha